MARVTQEHVDARKAAILEAAERLFARQGVGNATMQEIAEEADLSAGAIYRYYSSKDELLQAYFKHCVIEGPVALINQAATADSPREQLKAASEMVRQMWLTEGSEKVIGELETVLAGARQPEETGVLIREAREQVYEVVQAIIEEGQQQGEIDSDFDPRSLAKTLYAFVYGIWIMSLESEEEEVNAMFGALDQIVDRLAPCHRR